MCSAAAKSDILHRLKLAAKSYLLMTLHRPYNVDRPEQLAAILQALQECGRPVVFPVHPRTRKMIREFNILVTDNIRMIDPLGYLDFLSLQEHASLVLTDSGGIQEETTYLGVPCLTARPNTERPVTISMGTNQLVESESTVLVQAMQASLSGSRPKKKSPPLWDGHTAGRIVKVFRHA